MNRLLLGTKNQGKLRELQELLRQVRGLRLLTENDVSFSEVEETGATFLENALLKARAICAEVGFPVLAEDAGLEVAALSGAPGVRSARFSGEPVDCARNNALLLERLRKVEDRRARFVAVSALCLPNGQVFATSGVLRGRIAERPLGEGGFGYDPLFVPEGESRTLALMSLEEKNQISHRRRAIERMSVLLRVLLKDGEFELRSRPG
jgi:XTP/dITP diphosphohydrolase